MPTDRRPLVIELGSWWTLAMMVVVVALMAGVCVYAGYDLRRDNEPAGQVVTVRKPVLWMQDPDGGWHCEPWATFAEAVKVCDVNQLLEAGVGGPFDVSKDGVPVA